MHKKYDTFHERLAGYVEIAHKRFETEKFEAFSEEHLRTSTRRVLRIRGCEKRGQGRSEAMYPEHEVEEFTDLFWERIQNGIQKGRVSNEEAVECIGAPAQDVQVVRWGELGSVRAPLSHGGRRRGGNREISYHHRALGPAGRGRIKIYSCDSVAGRTWMTEEGSLEHRAHIQNMFHEFVAREVVPAILRSCQNDEIETIGRRIEWAAENALSVLCIMRSSSRTPYACRERSTLPK